MILLLSNEERDEDDARNEPRRRTVLSPFSRFEETARQPTNSRRGYRVKPCFLDLRTGTANQRDERHADYRNCNPD